MTNQQHKPLRILYAGSPGKVIGTYKYWRQGQEDPSQVSVTYSSQFYETCRTLNAEGFVISRSHKKDFLQEGQLILEQRPMPLQKASGVWYHLNLIIYGLYLVASAALWRADVAVVNEGTTHWFVLSLLPFLGVKVVPSLHCTLWCKYLPRRLSERIISRLNKHFFVRNCTAILSVSQDIEEQVKTYTEGQNRPIVEFIPTYKRAEFSGVIPPNIDSLQFRVLFAGRIEENKGVFDLLEIAKQMAATGRQDIIFDICGTGSALASLQVAAAQAGVESSFICHGYCNKPQMRERFNQSHVVIVPTTTAFAEGFCKVVAEGILAGRPVVTSSVVPALLYVGEAVVEVAPDDVQEYGNALLQLRDDRAFYEAKRQACFKVQEQFYDPSKSWEAALKSILRGIQDKQLS